MRKKAEQMFLGFGGSRTEREDVGSCLALLQLFDWIYSKCVCGLYNFDVWAVLRMCA